MESLIDGTTLITVLVGAFVVYIVIKDLVSGKKAARVHAAGVAQEAVPERDVPASVPPVDNPITSAPSAEKPAPEEKATEKEAEVTLEPVTDTKAETPAEDVPEVEEDKELDSFLEDVLNDIDDEENKIDQAWDKVNNANRQVSTHVSGMQQFIANGSKAMSEAMERQREMKKEEQLEVSRVKRAHELKIKGNQAYESGNCREAAKQYTECIRLMPETDETKYILYSNRSAANRMIGKFDVALTDAEKCISLRPDFVKGHTRLANVLEDTKRWGEAKAVYQKVLTEFAGNALCSDAEKGVTRCDQSLEDQLDDILNN